MAAKGQISKDKVASVLAEKFGEQFLGKHDNKYFINFIENGEKVQISVALTCVKNPIESAAAATAPVKDWNFEDDTPPWDDPIVVTKAEPAEVTQDEIDNLETLLAKLGL